MLVRSLSSSLQASRSCLFGTAVAAACRHCVRQGASWYRKILLLGTYALLLGSDANKHEVTTVFLKYICFYVFNWGGIKPWWTPDKEIWPNPISVSMGDYWLMCQPAPICKLTLEQSTSTDPLIFHIWSYFHELFLLFLTANRL